MNDSLKYAASGRRSSTICGATYVHDKREPRLTRASAQWQANKDGPAVNAFRLTIISTFFALAGGSRMTCVCCCRNSAVDAELAAAVARVKY